MTDEGPPGTDVSQSAAGGDPPTAGLSDRRRVEAARRVHGAETAVAGALAERVRRLVRRHRTGPIGAVRRLVHLLRAARHDPAVRRVLPSEIVRAVRGPRRAAAPPRGPGRAAGVAGAGGRAAAPGPDGPVVRVCLFSPADLNIVSGASVWVEAVAQVLRAGPGTEVVIPLRTVERRALVTGPLRQLEGVELVDPRRLRPYVPAAGLEVDEVLDLIEALDAERPFDVILVRSFAACLAAIQREALRDRLWSAYILEPERDIQIAQYREALARIADASRHVVVQSGEMQALLESIVPGVRGRTVILPPAVPAPASPEAPVPEPAARLWYAGKFHPFYPVPLMLDAFEGLRPDHPGLEFHVIGDQVFRPPGGDAWADELERRLVSTPGVTWHGAVGRDDVVRLMRRGGIALSLWDYRHGDRMNDLVVSTKLLDYCRAGLPTVLNRTAAQATILGSDYPLFVDRAEDALPVIRRALDEPALAVAAAERCRDAALRFTYPAIRRSIDPYLRARPSHEEDRRDAATSEARVD